MTYSENSKANRLYLSLRDLGIDERATYGLDDKKYDSKTFSKLVVFTPTTQSHLGDKFDSYRSLNNRTLDKFLKALFSGMGIKNVYLFTSYTEKTRKKKDLRNSVINDKDALLCLRCDNGVRDSLYMSIRNSIAHGNLLEKDGFIILYSVSEDKAEYDSAITFFMRIKQISKLQALFRTLEAYR